MPLPGGHEITCKVTLDSDLVEPLVLSHCRIIFHWKWEPQHFPYFLFIVKEEKVMGRKDLTACDCSLKASSVHSNAAGK